jgi:carboxymethylenebutenolidase
MSARVEGDARAGEPTRSEVAFPGVDGDLVGVLFSPPGGTMSPAVLVLPEIDGFCDGTVAAAHRLARSGYVALALDPFAPYGSAPPLRGSADTMAWLARLNDRRQLSDLVMAIGWLRARPDVDAERVGVVGFSIGGRFGMMLTTEPHGLRAVVAFYSRPWPGGAIAEVALAPGHHVAKFNAPVCAIFGAEDELIPPDMVEEFGSLLSRHPSSGHQLHVVPGRHFFANESRPRRYVPSSAEQAWAIVHEFLATHLAAPTG